MVPTLARTAMCVCDVCGIAWWFWGRYACVHAIEWLRAIFPCEIFNQWCACRQILCGLFSRSLSHSVICFLSFQPEISSSSSSSSSIRTKAHSSSFINLRHIGSGIGNKGTTIVTLSTQKIVLLLGYNDINILCLWMYTHRMLFIYSVCLFHFVSLLLFDMANWKRLKNMNIEQIRRARVNKQNILVFWYGMERAGGERQRQKQTNWFESLDQPSTPVTHKNNAINRYKTHTQTRCKCMLLYHPVAYVYFDTEIVAFISVFFGYGVRLCVRRLNIFSNPQHFFGSHCHCNLPHSRTKMPSNEKRMVFHFIECMKPTKCSLRMHTN